MEVVSSSTIENYHEEIGKRPKNQIFGLSNIYQKQKKIEKYKQTFWKISNWRSQPSVNCQNSHSSSKNLSKYSANTQLEIKWEKCHAAKELNYSPTSCFVVIKITFLSN